MDNIDEQTSIAVERIRTIIKSTAYHDYITHYSSVSPRFRDLPTDIKLAMYYQIHYGAGKLEDSLSYYHDILYDRPIVDIDTFLTDMNYVGALGNNVYPRWRSEMKEFLSDESIQREWVFSGAIGTGKSLIHGSLVKTDTGWNQIENISIGDKVDSGFGEYVSVNGVYPQGEKKVYKVTFADGRTSLCCEEHLWLVLKWGRLKKASVLKEHVLSTKEIQNQLVNKKNSNLFIPLYQPHESAQDISLPISPYLLGALLGDGCIRGNILFTNIDQHIIDKVDLELNKINLKLRSRSDGVHHYFSYLIPQVRNNILKKSLINLNLYGTYSHTKFIPEIYKHASLYQKTELLKGLFDTDGTIDIHGNITYYTASILLAQDIQSLIWSIGGICKIKIKQPYYVYKGKRNKGKICYILQVRIAKQTSLFSLPRKLARCNDNNQYAKYLKLRIDSIEELSHSEPMTCISVSGEKHTYVTDDYIITHNTTVGRMVALYKLYQMCCLRNPQATFGLTPESIIAMVFVSISQKKSRETALKPFVSLLRMCAVFEEVGDQNKLLIYKGNKIPFSYNIADSIIRVGKSISITIGSSIDDLIGMNVFASFYDEAEAGGDSKGVLDLYHEMKTRIKSRFGISQFNFAAIISSARKQNGAIQTYLSKLDAVDKPYVRVSEFTKWEVATPVGFDPFVDGAFYVLNGTINYPSSLLTDEQAKYWLENPEQAPSGTEVLKIPITYLRDFKLNLEKALQDIAGVPTATNGVPFPDTTKIVDKRLVRSLRMKAPISTPDSTEIITKLINNLPPESYVESVTKDGSSYRWYRYPNAVRYMAVDLAEVNEAALSLVHKEKNLDGESIIVVDLCITFYTNTRIRLDSIWDFMIDFKKKFNFRLHTAAFDQYQSAVFRQRAQEVYYAENNILLSVDRSPDAYLHLANLVARGGFKIGDCSDIKAQMGAITQDDNGKIIKPYVTDESHCDGLDTLVSASYCAHLNNGDVPSLLYLPEDTPVEQHQDALINATMKKLKLSW